MSLDSYSGAPRGPRASHGPLLGLQSKVTNFMKQGSRRAIERAGEARGWVGGVYALRLSTRMPDTRGTQMPDRGTDRETTHKTTVYGYHTHVFRRVPGRGGAPAPGPAPRRHTGHAPLAAERGPRPRTAVTGVACAVESSHRRGVSLAKSMKHALSLRNFSSPVRYYPQARVSTGACGRAAPRQSARRRRPPRGLGRAAPLVRVLVRAGTRVRVRASGRRVSSSGVAGRRCAEGS